MTWSAGRGSLELDVLRAAYADGLSPREVVAACHDRIAAHGETHAWIHLAPRAETLARAAAAERMPPGGRGPLWGVPFSVKDCNDVPGMPTTNAFPATAYRAETTGLAIRRLLEAGAIPLGKVNMDQFGIGLVGMRTPYGACASVFDPAYISGGSSSGSGVSVALGEVSFSIANDAAGSGRVPAAFNNVVGVKPTPGLVSGSSVSGGGCVKTIETIAVFALTTADGMAVLRTIAGYEPSFPFSKPEADRADLSPRPAPARFVAAVPTDAWLRFFGDREAERLFRAALPRLEAMGATIRRIDFAPFEETQRILYEGAWIAERALTLDPVLAAHREAIHPVTRAILEEGSAYSARDTFRAFHRVAELKAATRPLWAEAECLVVPTTPTIYRKEEIAADPIRLNAHLGIYTNFANLMGLCAVAVPNGFRADGVPQGITFLGDSWQESRVAAIAGAYHRSLGLPLGRDGPVHA